ncbi:MAG: sce7726 family protein [Gammaproteobacteria bacterium]|nr:sce7726 family protein [Gammaproteobacteria bacterium]
MQSTDIEIRKAFHNKRLISYHNCPKTLVIDELGVSHGQHRIDIAVLNGCIHGYEIKSSKDNLSRLYDQLTAYSKCFEKLSFIVAPNHIDEVLSLAPEWCGVILAEKGARGGIYFSSLRRAKKNPDIEIQAMAHFLWKKETINLLKFLGVEERKIKGARQNLYEALPGLITPSELSVWIKKQFMQREDWRVAQQPLLDGDLRRPAST